MAALDRINLTKAAVSDDVIPNGHQNGMSPQSAEAEPSSVDRESLRNEIQSLRGNVGRGVVEGP